jgi:hypothetical protein
MDSGPGGSIGAVKDGHLQFELIAPAFPICAVIPIPPIGFANLLRHSSKAGGAGTAVTLDFEHEQNPSLIHAPGVYWSITDSQS